MYQGLLLSLHRAIVGRQSAGEGIKRSWVAWLRQVVGIAVFFQVVCYGWMLFRASSFSQIMEFTGRVVGVIPTPSAMVIPMPPMAAFLGIGVLFLWDLMIERSGDVEFYAGWPMAVRAGLYASMVYLLAFGATTASSAFIYFQF